MDGWMNEFVGGAADGMAWSRGRVWAKDGYVSDDDYLS